MYKSFFMTKNRPVIFTGYLLTSLVLLSCSKMHDNKCLSFTNAPVTKIEGPNTGSVNQDINLIVSFGCFNGCGQFGNFKQTSNSGTTIVNVIAKYEGCICTQDAPIRQAPYKFNATQTGTYYLKFWQAENNYLTDTITIR